MFILDLGDFNMKYVWVVEDTLSKTLFSSKKKANEFILKQEKNMGDYVLYRQRIL